MCPCVKSGTADIVVARPGAAKPERFKTLQSGSYFGEMALLSDERRSASVVAKSEGVLWGLDRANFRRASHGGNLLKVLRSVQVATPSAPRSCPPAPRCLRPLSRCSY